MQDFLAFMPKKEIDAEKEYGFIEKRDLYVDSENPTKIFLRADLHGDLKSLIENLKKLQEKGLLDENFKCMPGVQIVFLGDFTDRGIYNFQILDLLLKLKLQNPNQVHLIRGNHESPEMHCRYNERDQLFASFVKSHESLFNELYEQFPLAIYFSSKTETQDHREYILCSHALFDVAVDPSELIDSPHEEVYMKIPKEQKLSERMLSIIADKDHPLHKQAKRIQTIVNEIFLFLVRGNVFGTQYNWGDIAKALDIETLENIEETLSRISPHRGIILSARDIENYFDCSSDTHKVKKLIRGHEHGYRKTRSVKHPEDIIAYTLSVGSNSYEGYQYRYGYTDISMVIDLQPLIANSPIELIRRESESDLLLSIDKFVCI